MLFILITAIVLISAYLIYTRPEKPNYKKSETPIYDQLEREMGFKKWDI